MAGRCQSMRLADGGKTRKDGVERHRNRCSTVHRADGALSDPNVRVPNLTLIPTFSILFRNEDYEPFAAKSQAPAY